MRDASLFGGGSKAFSAIRIDFTMSDVSAIRDRMKRRCPISLRTLAAALLAGAAWNGGDASTHADSGDAREAVIALFRGCDDTRTCRFAFVSDSAGQGELFRVLPEGVRWRDADDETARAVRDRLNALLSSMIHQHKRVELHGLRSTQGNHYAARVTVNGEDVAEDAVLRTLTGSPVAR